MFILDNNDQTPLYKQLYHQIRAHALSGKLPADFKLPSVRTLADELSTSRNTVDTAYQELYAEGYIYSKPRSGYFVSALDQDAAPLSLPQKPRNCNRLPVPPQRYNYDFHPARLDPESFPVPLWRKLFMETLRESSKQFVRYGDSQGEWGLRCFIQQYLERSRGVVCDPEQIVVCSGLSRIISALGPLLSDRAPGFTSFCSCPSMHPGKRRSSTGHWKKESVCFRSPPPTPQENPSQRCC